MTTSTCLSASVDSPRHDLGPVLCYAGTDQNYTANEVRSRSTNEMLIKISIYEVPLKGIRYSY